MITKGFYAENTTLLNQLGQSVKRVELCDNLAIEGTTPSYGVTKEAARYLHKKDIALATMTRPRGSNFVYNDSGLRIMEDDILHAVELESDSLVLGLLTEDNHTGQDGIKQLLPTTQGLLLAFHMVLDYIPLEEQKGALDQLVELGFTRILTHGSAQNNDIFENITHLKDPVDYADGRVEIIIGGSITADNYQELVEKAGAQAAYGIKTNCVL